MLKWFLPAKDTHWPQCRHLQQFCEQCWPVICILKFTLFEIPPRQTWPHLQSVRGGAVVVGGAGVGGGGGRKHPVER